MSVWVYITITTPSSAEQAPLQPAVQCQMLQSVASLLLPTHPAEAAEYVRRSSYHLCGGGASEIFEACQ